MSGSGGSCDRKVAVVTGAASGIGRATAEKLAAEGAKVVAADLDEAGLAWTDEAPAIVGQPGDVSSEADNQAFVDRATQEFGGLDIMVLNAGMPATAAIDQLPWDDYQRVIDVNLNGVVRGIRAAIPALRNRQGGAIVVTASVSGLGGDPGMWAYNTAKGGVINLVRAASLDLAREDIRVNAVCPGPVRTKMTSIIEEYAAEMFEGLRRHVPMQRWGDPAEVAEVITFLASGAASFVTGAIVPVDGGLTASSGQFVPPERG